jgi:MFS family permease
MNLLIDKTNLQWGLVASGLFYLVILLPICYWFRNRPEDMGLLPDGATRPPAVTGTRGATRQEYRDYTVREALRTQAYWFLLLGAGLRQTATLGILVSLFPILIEDKGMSPQMAANLVGAMSAINFVSRLVMGYLGDRVSKKAILGLSLTVEGIGYLFLWLGDWQTAVGITLVLGFVICEGMMDGAGVIVWAALGEYFGRSRFATLRGYITFGYAWALVASPVYAGWIYDRFGNYDRAIVPGAICAMIAGVFFMLIKKPPVLTAESPDPSDSD